MVPQSSASDCRHVAPQYLYFVLVGLMAALTGCASGPTRKTALIKSSKHVETSAVELSSRNQSLLALYSAEIEAAADKIILQSHSAATQRQALVWKAEAIPVLQTSLLNVDPLAAALDTWAFILQMQAYVQQPAVKQGFGESHAVVVATLNRMENEMEQLLQTVAPSANMPAIRQEIASWAEANPIEAGLAGRKSLDAVLIQRTEQSDLGARASVRAISESIGDITARLDSYNAYLPKQARWQAELLINDLEGQTEITAAAAHLEVLSSSLEKASSGMEHMPELMAEARKTVLADVEGQRLATQAFFTEERIQALNTLDRERLATMADLRQERLAATADLRQERQIVLDALHNEQVAVMGDLQAASDKAIKDLDATSRSLIDHFFVRALQLMLLAILITALVAWFLLRRFTTRGRYQGELYDRAA